MAEPLWQWDELVAAAQGARRGRARRAPITGFSIDTRTLQPGDVFVALKDERDGHEFVAEAFKAGAAAAIVAHGYRARKADGALLRVDDPLRGAGRHRPRRARRAATRASSPSPAASARPAPRRCCACACRSPGATHAAEKSYNNHWGVPLTLARMPPDARYGVFEIGMNHAGEITPLAQMVRPHVAVITTVEPVHLGSLPVGRGDRRGQGRDFAGPGARRHRRAPARQPAFPAAARARRERSAPRSSPSAITRRPTSAALQVDLGAKGSSVIAGHGSQRFPYRVGAPGEHFVQNSLAVLAALGALGADAMRCPAGAGAHRRTRQAAARARCSTCRTTAVLLIDESYNANPASMRAALAAMATTPREAFPRRIAVLGDMLELGDASPDAASRPEGSG